MENLCIVEKFLETNRKIASFNSNYFFLAQHLQGEPDRGGGQGCGSPCIINLQINVIFLKIFFIILYE